MNGDVIGINTAILGRNGSIGIGFSIPANDAKLVIDQLIEFGETKRGWLPSSAASRAICDGGTA
jgi:serine protease Do